MNKNKLIALLVILAVFFGPFGMLFVYDNNLVVHSAREMFLFLGWLIGMFVAFYIGVNEPFGKKAVARTQSTQQSAQMHKAA